MPTYFFDFFMLGRNPPL